MQQTPAPALNRFIDAPIPDVIVRDLGRFTDARGWLTELFRRDELAEEYLPAMSYISATVPGSTRGPHEHVDQADIFYFLGPSDFQLRMWDNRKDSPTYGYRMTLLVGETDPKSVLIPCGVVHAYRNIGAVDGIVINCPNRLYMGDGRREPVDEIRHEDDPQTVFTMND